MIKFIIDIFCKDTIIGLSAFEDIRGNRIYKNKYKHLFKNKPVRKVKFSNYFIDPTVCHP